MQKPDFRIGTSTHTADELKGTIELQLNYVGSLFDPLQKEVGEAIHETRQICKRCRAILRLMGDSMGYAFYYRENRNVRDLQRELAPLRDADVQQQLLGRLSGNFPEHARSAWFSGLMERAKQKYDLKLDHFLNEDKASRISDRARSAAAQIKTYQLSGKGFGIIESGLTRIYRQGREMGDTVFSEDAEDVEVHNLRKKAKYLQNQLFYLRPIQNELVGAMSASLGQLTEILGYYNDLSLLCNNIREYAEETNLVAGDHGKFLAGLRAEMQQLKSDSRQIYADVYSEPPEAFARRIGNYWESYYRTLKTAGSDRNRSG